MISLCVFCCRNRFFSVIPWANALVEEWTVYGYQIPCMTSLAIQRFLVRMQHMFMNITSQAFLCTHRTSMSATLQSEPFTCRDHQSHIHLQRTTEHKDVVLYNSTKSLLKYNANVGTIWYPFNAKIISLAPLVLPRSLASRRHIRMLPSTGMDPAVSVQFWSQITGTS